MWYRERYILTDSQVRAQRARDHPHTHDNASIVSPVGPADWSSDCEPPIVHCHAQLRPPARAPRCARAGGTPATLWPRAPSRRCFPSTPTSAHPHPTPPPTTKHTAQAAHALSPQLSVGFEDCTVLVQKIFRSPSLSLQSRNREISIVSALVLSLSVMYLGLYHMGFSGQMFFLDTERMISLGHREIYQPLLNFTRLRPPSSTLTYCTNDFVLGCTCRRACMNG